MNSILSLLAQTSPPETGGSAIAVVMGIFFALFALAVVAFWVWTLIDCIKNEPSEGNDKIIWILVIVLVGWIGSIIYMFVRRPKRIAEQGH